MLSPEIEVLSPLRGKAFDELLSEIPHYVDTSVANSRSILARDFFDVRRSDMVLANLLGAQSISTGTVMEIAWCHALRIPLVLVMEAEGNKHDHMMLNEVAGWRVETLMNAVEIIRDALI